MDAEFTPSPTLHVRNIQPQEIVAEVRAILNQEVTWQRSIKIQDHFDPEKKPFECTCGELLLWLADFSTLTPHNLHHNSSVLPLFTEAYKKVLNLFGGGLARYSAPGRTWNLLAWSKTLLSRYELIFVEDKENHPDGAPFRLRMEYLCVLAFHLLYQTLWCEYSNRSVDILDKDISTVVDEMKTLCFEMKNAKK